MKLLKWFFVLTLFAIVGAGLVSYQAYQNLIQPIAITAPQVYAVEKGSYLGRILYDLKQQGVITDDRWARYYAKYQQLENVKVGEFELQPGMTVVDVLHLLNSDKVLRYQVTLVEGKTSADYLDQLRAHPKLKITTKGLSIEEIMSELGVEGKHPEGMFAPETYTFSKGTSDFDILKQSFKRQEKVLAAAWAEKSSDLPIKSPYEALILASIVEKETGVARERPEIAGVFVRRLQQNIRLQTDPTVIYGLGDKYNGNLTRAHLKAYTPYNTYRINGLPPTPIANPGKDAIEAVLHPADGETLYFVAKGDGSHHFSKTLKEHINAVNKFQRFKRRKDYQSAPEAPKDGDG